MADYKGFLRFSDEAVASVNWNDQQHSGEAGVTDETTGSVYPFGGGGDDLIELEYTVAGAKVSLTKTPTELWELLQAGKNFKLVVNSDLANYGGLDVGDVFTSVQYTLENEVSLQTLDFYISPLPTNQGDTGGKWYGMFFAINNDNILECAFD